MAVSTDLGRLIEARRIRIAVSLYYSRMRRNAISRASDPGRTDQAGNSGPARPTATDGSDGPGRAAIEARIPRQP
jgi:hypothetical protein